jgi:hypothetical protein
MSYEIGSKALELEFTERIAHTEYCDHTGVVRFLSGLEPLNPETAEQAYREFFSKANYDFLWYSNDGPQWEGRITSMGHAAYVEGGKDYDNKLSCPFSSVEEVLSFDPVAEYTLPDIKERTVFFATAWKNTQQAYPDLVLPAGYYKTLFSACIQAFGWEMFLCAAGTDHQRFDRVLEGFYKISEANFKAWAETGIRYFICHDDIVWSNGAVFHPDWYRKYIFPRYKKLWTILKEKGMKVIFCSDGNFTEFIDDIANAGADGFIFEPMTDLDYIVEKYGKTKIIMGNVDCRVLTWGSRHEIEQEVTRCIIPGKKCPGFFIAVGNHIPSNVPLENILYYFDLVEKHGKR